MSKKVWQHSFVSANGRKKTIQILYGDICAVEDDYDVVVCSAFKGNYVPTPKTLIGALRSELGISVDDLSKKPEVDVKSMGCWLSREIQSKFRRVACVEILGLSDIKNGVNMDAKLLSSVFSTMRFVLEQASLRSLPIRSVISPILGAGKQRMELSYVAGPLIHQCMQALQTIDELECFTFCERNPENAQELALILQKIIASDLRPDVFISYSSKQTDMAYKMRDCFKKRELKCWMAPDSIPAGASYLSEIPVALSRVSIVALLLTPDAESSRWVQKEVGTAIGNGRILIPYQPYKYKVGSEFHFLLDGEQIFSGWEYEDEERLEKLASYAVQKLMKYKKDHAVESI